MNRLTKRNDNGGITVTDVPAALEKLAVLEDAEKFMSIAEVHRVLLYGDWRRYFHPPDTEETVVLDQPLDELQRALCFISALSLWQEKK